MAEQHSISSAVFGLQETLRDLQQKLPCLSNTSTQKQSNGTSMYMHDELHALGTVNLDKVRQEFTQHVNSIRNICSQFETEVLGDVMKMGAGADPAFRKHFTHLKEQATLESTVMRVKDTLKHTKAFFEDSIKEKEESRSKIETQRLEKIAQSMGLVTFIDSSQKIESGASITTITLGGTVIVIDIDIDDTGRVLKAKVTYVSETLQNDQDDRVDTMFAESLQSRQYDLFKRNLASLALLDQLNVKYSSVDFFLIMKNLFHDLKTIYSQEIAMVSDESRVLLEGHGMPMQHLDYPDKETIKSNTLENRNTSRLLLSFEDSVQPMYYLPPSQSSYLAGYEEAIGEHFKAVTETMTPSFMSPFRFIQPLSTHPEVQAVPIRFVATLDSPLAVSDQVCQKLMTVAGLSNGELVSDVSLDTCTLSLEEMLLKDGHDKNKLTQNNWVTVSTI
ncbi:uncharacterized protein B0P05DRAFT_574427 [Gilbertella persicaria]|uniref:uncharacterized protein n=1 Tax=Gilbertella persicaria TaxID=101096 RepID=UPI0022201C14|nr:uncharacterized protein B0P05DRAFT_574427 [Gilbertella persicaria]KAI8062836.1 hypothetical protein B0P05DRAFT_574427 [Gilbertella persicaria]